MRGAARELQRAGSIAGSGGELGCEGVSAVGEGFERRCRAEGLLARAGLEEALRGSLAGGEDDLGEAEILLVGFDALTPAQARFVDALLLAGVVVEELRGGELARERVLVMAEDESEELRVCAEWVRRFLEEDGAARVAVIVPGLAGQRAEIERVFREVLVPELEDIGAGEREDAVRVFGRGGAGPRRRWLRRRWICCDGRRGLCRWRG